MLLIMLLAVGGAYCSGWCSRQRECHTVHLVDSVVDERDTGLGDDVAEFGYVDSSTHTGPWCEPNATRFPLWSPKSSNAHVALMNEGTYRICANITFHTKPLHPSWDFAYKAALHVGRPSWMSPIVVTAQTPAIRTTDDGAKHSLHMCAEVHVGGLFGYEVGTTAHVKVNVVHDDWWSGKYLRDRAGDFKAPIGTMTVSELVWL